MMGLERKGMVPHAAQAKDDANERATTPIPGKKKFAKAKADAKKANALVATMEEQRKKDE